MITPSVGLVTSFSSFTPAAVIVHTAVQSATTHT
ncbi:MAG: light-harvesting protein [Bacteroidaceae bacterium]|nr:light-harvesting protein [Bacteroidaceae bacterium]